MHHSVVFVFLFWCFLSCLCLFRTQDYASSYDACVKKRKTQTAVARVFFKSNLHEYIVHPISCFLSGLSCFCSQRQRKRIKRARGGAKRRQGQGQDQGRRKDNDPLQTFEASELGADGSYGVRGPGGAPREGGGGGGSGGSGGDEGWGDEGDREAAAKRMNEERESRVMQVQY